MGRLQKRINLKNKRIFGQAMTEYAILMFFGFCGAATIYTLMMSALNIYLRSIYFVLNLPLP